MRHTCSSIGETIFSYIFNNFPKQKKQACKLAFCQAKTNNHYCYSKYCKCINEHKLPFTWLSCCSFIIKLFFNLQRVCCLIYNSSRCETEDFPNKHVCYIMLSASSTMFVVLLIPVQSCSIFLTDSHFPKKSQQDESWYVLSYSQSLWCRNLWFQCSLPTLPSGGL